MLSILFILFLSCNHEPINYSHETAEDKKDRMEWWEEARFGMFIHWGLYAIPAGEWNGESNHAEWIRTTARIPIDTYNGFVDEFNPVKYDPEQWVMAAKKAGMKYIVITSKHHDGFCLFDSRHTDFDIMSTPYQKDILDQLARACHREGIKICWYHSIMDWHHPDYMPRRGWEKDRSDTAADFENYVDHMKLQIKELVENYGDIGVLWFDGEWENTWTHERGQDLYNYVRNLQPDIIINNRVDVGRSGMAGFTRPGDYAGDFGTPEQEIPATGLPGVYWETCMTMNNYWGYNKSDNDWKSAPELIRKLTDIASKGGNFLLNVGPKADGTLPENSLSILTGIGEWMEVNGNAIYGTSASPFRKLNFGRCTHITGKDNTVLYMHIFDWPESGLLKIPGIYNSPLNAYFLADPKREKLEVYRIEDALNIRLPATPHDTVNTVVVLTVAGMPDISNPPLINGDNGIFIDLISVSISTENKNTDVRYTLDGSIPDTNSQKVDGNIVLDNSAVIIARCFRDGVAVSDTSMYRVRKTDPIPAIQVENIASGLICKYYEGNWDSLPDFNALTPMKQINATQFDISVREDDDHYGFLFDGLIQIPGDGIYTFYTASDDGSQLYIDDQLIVENDGLHGFEEAKGVIPLSEGLHRIRVTFFEKEGDDDLKIFYDGPDFERMSIPSYALFHQMKAK